MPDLRSRRHGADLDESLNRSDRATCLRELRGIRRQLASCAKANGASASNPVRHSSGVVLMVSGSCNLACRYCYAAGSWLADSQSMMGWDVARAALDFLIRRAPERRAFTIVFFGGEPLLNFPLIEDIVHECKVRTAHGGPSFGFTITTNGTILNTPILDFLREHRFGVLISCDGNEVEQDGNRPFKSGRGSFAQVARNFRALRAAGVSVEMRATLVRGTLTRRSVDGLTALAHSLDAERLALCPVEGAAGVPSELVPTASELDDFAGVSRDIADDNLSNAVAGSTARVLYDQLAPFLRLLATNRNSVNRSCGACFGMTAVGCDGKLYPCHRFVGMPPYVIGDVWSGAAQSRVAQFFERANEALRGECGTCWAYGSCRGVCFHHAADGAGGFRRPSAEECDRIRRSIEDNCRLLARLASLPADVQRRYWTSVARL